MKKLIKNIIIIFLMSFAILSIAGFIYNFIQNSNMLYNEVAPILNGDITQDVIRQEEQYYNMYKQNYGENAPTNLLNYCQGYLQGEGHILEMQNNFLVISAVIGISFGIIISLSEKSKIKEILIFINVGIILALLATTVIRIGNLYNCSFGDTLTQDVIKPYILYYIALYVVVYITRYFIAKRSAKKLNDEINKK